MGRSEVRRRRVPLQNPRTARFTGLFFTLIFNLIAIEMGDQRDEPFGSSVILPFYEFFFIFIV